MVDGSGENGERSSSAVKELETVTERLGEGLDRLGNGVNEIFNSVLSTRKGMLEKMRVGPPQEKRSDAKNVTSNLYTKRVLDNVSPLSPHNKNGFDDHFLYSTPNMDNIKTS